MLTSNHDSCRRFSGAPPRNSRSADRPASSASSAHIQRRTSRAAREQARQGRHRRAGQVEAQVDPQRPCLRQPAEVTLVPGTDAVQGVEVEEVDEPVEGPPVVGPDAEQAREQREHAEHHPIGGIQAQEPPPGVVGGPRRGGSAGPVRDHRPVEQERREEEEQRHQEVQPDQASGLARVLVASAPNPCVKSQACPIRIATAGIPGGRRSAGTADEAEAARPRPGPGRPHSGCRCAHWLEPKAARVTVSGKSTLHPVEAGVLCGLLLLDAEAGGEAIQPARLDGVLSVPGAEPLLQEHDERIEELHVPLVGGISNT